jgi:EAL domain-containing protein (putative c-di-GMP-specific phosphodiesterase class I)
MHPLPPGEGTSAPSPETATLYVCPALAETAARLRVFFSVTGLPFHEPSPRVLAVELGRETLRQLATDLPVALTAAELQEAKFLLVTGEEAPVLADMVHMRSLSLFVAGVRHEWFEALLSGERLQTHFHPIVRLLAPHEVYAYECLLRGEDAAGGMIPASFLFGVARTVGLHGHLDRLARRAAIRDALRHHVDGRIFINFNPAAVYHPAGSLRGTIEAVERASWQAERVVFEVVESEAIDDVDRLVEVLATYRAAGFRVALDDLGAGYGSLNLLTKLRPDFVKLDMELIRGVDRDPYKAHIASKLLEMAKSLGVETVVEGVETPGEWGWARDNGADFAQGFLLARPAAPPPMPASWAATV